MKLKKRNRIKNLIECKGKTYKGYSIEVKTNDSMKHVLTNNYVVINWLVLMERNEVERITRTQKEAYESRDAQKKPIGIAT